MKVLVSCEYSGRVREAFLRRGHNAISCDLLRTEVPGPHYKGNVLDILYSEHWDLLIAHPPCTYLASSGARWWHKREKEQQDALTFVRTLLDAPIKHIVVENPIGAISTEIRKPDQIIHPWQFGHGEKKATCLWLKNLPKLTPTSVVEGRSPTVHYSPDNKLRWKERSRTYQGIADAMATQWG